MIWVTVMWGSFFSESRRQKIKATEVNLGSLTPIGQKWLLRCLDAPSIMPLAPFVRLQGASLLSGLSQGHANVTEIIKFDKPLADKPQHRATYFSRNWAIATAAIWKMGIDGGRSKWVRGWRCLARASRKP